MNLDLDVLGAGSWTPRQPTEQELPLASGESAARPSTQLLAARARGRASLLTLMFANVVEQASAGAGVKPEQLPSIYASAYGEMATTLSLLAMLHAGDGRLSPAKFQASVHNTAGGTISIALSNRSFSTSIAAGYDTLAMALIEAGAWLSRHPGLVLVACADEGSPQPLLPELSYDALAIGLVLSNAHSPGEGHQAPLARLGQLVQTTGPHAVEGERDNPCAAGLDLVRAVHAASTGSSETIVLNRSSRQPWQIDVSPASPYTS